MSVTTQDKVERIIALKLYSIVLKEKDTIARLMASRDGIINLFNSNGDKAVVLVIEEIISDNKCKVEVVDMNRICATPKLYAEVENTTNGMSFKFIE